MSADQEDDGAWLERAPQSSGLGSSDTRGLMRLGSTVGSTHGPFQFRKICTLAAKFSAARFACYWRVAQSRASEAWQAGLLGDCQFGLTPGSAPAAAEGAWARIAQFDGSFTPYSSGNNCSVLRG